MQFLRVIFYYTKFNIGFLSHGISIQFVEAMVFGEKYNNSMRMAAKQGGTPETIFDHEAVKEAWQAIEHLLSNEEVERKAAAAALTEVAEGGDEIEENSVVSLLRQAPSNFVEKSEAFWKAVANTTVRTFITIIVEPKTPEGVRSALEQAAAIKDVKGLMGQTSVITYVDLDTLGESQGPNAQKMLRKRFNPSPTLLRKLVHSSTLARGSQKKSDQGEATCPAEGEVVLIHVSKDRSIKETRSLFRLASSKTDNIDCEEKELLLAFDDASMRNRKKRVRGGSSYSCRSVLHFFHSGKPGPEHGPRESLPALFRLQHVGRPGLHPGAATERHVARWQARARWIFQIVRHQFPA